MGVGAVGGVGGALPPLPLAAPAPAAGPAAAPAAGGAAAPSFAGALGQAVNSLSQMQTSADAAAQGLASGSNTDIATAVVAAEKANLTLQLAVEVRNRAVAAYQTFMQMQV